MSGGDPPLLATVVMPVRDEERFIRASLGAVLAQDVPEGALEVLVVDGRSSDRTRAIVEELADGARFPVRLLDNPGRIAATALNIGFAQARADVVVRVDGHAEVPPDYVGRLLDVLRRTGAEAVGGVVRATASDARGEAIQCAMRSPLGHGGASFRSLLATVEREADTVGFPAYRKDAVLAVGGFDEALVRNQDDDLHLRLRMAGGRLVLVPDLVVTYRSRLRPSGLVRQYFGYGFWKVVCARKNGRLTSQRAWGPATFVAAVAVFLVYATAVLLTVGGARLPGPVGLWDLPWFAVLVVLPAGLAWLGFHIVSIFTGTPRPASRRWRLVTPEVALLLMYLSYGVGFWWAVLRGGRPPRRAA